MAYPTDEGQTYVDVTLNDVRGENEADGLNHATRHNKIQDEITALKNKVGIDGDSDTGSLDYKVANKQDILSEGAFVNGDKTKLDEIETGATADLTGSEIKVLYEGESDTNAFTDAEKTKLTGIALGAEVNVNADWNASSGDAEILNKPTIPDDFSDFTNVDATVATPSDGDILVYRTAGSDWVLEAKPAGGSTPAINDITDVTITSTADNEVLAYDSGTGEWINQTASEAGLATASHTHSAITKTLTLRCDRLSQYDDDDTVKVADGVEYVPIPPSMNGMNLVSAHAYVITAGTTGTTDIQVHNVTDAVDMLSTKITIDSGETSSQTAATAPVINTSNDDVATGDMLRIDVDAVSTTAPKGLYVQLEFE